MTPVRRRAARWARAFPPRWRAGHLDEFLDTVEAMAPDGATRLPWRIALDIVLAGWGERLRRHPPLGRWLAYCVDRRLPARWHDWVLDDVGGRWFWLRTWARRVGLLIVVWTAIWLGQQAVGLDPGGYPWVFLVGPVLATPVAFLVAGSARRRTLARHGLTAVGGFEPPPPPWIPPAPVPPVASHPVRGTAGALAVGCASVGGALLWGAAYPRPTASGVFGRVVTDGNAPIGRLAVVALAAGATALGGLALGVAVRAARGRLPGTVADRPPLAARQVRLRRLLTLVFAAVVAQLTWAGIVSMPPDAGSAVVGAALLVAAGGALGLAVGARGGPGTPTFTWADLMASRSPLSTPTPTTARSGPGLPTQ